MLQHRFQSDDGEGNLRQFLAALHCVSEMAKVDLTAEPLVNCGVVKIVVKMLHQIIPNEEDLVMDGYNKNNKKLAYATEVEAMSYLWSILANLSNNADYLRRMIASENVIEVISKESVMGLNKCRAYVAHLILHISKILRNDDIKILPDQTTSLNEFVLTVRRFLSNPWGREGNCQSGSSRNAQQVVSLALLALVYLAENVHLSRAFILSNDLLKLLQEAVHLGQGQARGDVFCAILLLYILSKEESLCIKLLENEAHSAIVSYFSYAEKISKNSPKNVAVEGKRNPRRLSISKETTLPLNDGVQFAARCGDLIAATLLNLSLKRAVLGQDILPLLLNLLKNCRTSRAMWIARCLANVSAHPRAKALLIKEPRLVEVVTGVMRNGSEEAEKAQLHCSILLCNLLAQSVPRSMVERMIKLGEVTDIIVVALLRVSSHPAGPSDNNDNNKTTLSQLTKVNLGKGLFNLLSRLDSRAEMVRLGVFDALVDLSKIENHETLELSMRTVYNISCEVGVYSEALLRSGVPSLLCNVLTSFGHGTPLTVHQGAKPTHKIKLIAAKAAANISFDIHLVFALSKCPEISDAIFVMSGLNSQEAIYCAAVVVFNMSIPETSHMMLNGLRERVVRAASSNILNCYGRLKNSENDKENTAVVTFLSDVVRTFLDSTATPNLCGQLAIGSLCNFSLAAVFHEQCARIAMVHIINVLSSPRCALETKIDAIRFLYNVITSEVFPESRVLSIQNNLVQGISNVLKFMTPEDEATMNLIGLILMEICNEKDSVYRLVLEGISKALIRLAKVENPSLKFNISRAIFRVSQVPDGVTKVIQLGDGVDILFWLTIHDCLGDFPPILANVSRTLKNFAISPVDSRNLVKEERLVSVLKVLARSDNEDILWHTAAAVLNILKDESSRSDMVKRGITAIIFSLANGGNGYTSVRYICSACLHTIPDSLPDMNDPSVLPLVLCLLDAHDSDLDTRDPDARANDEVSQSLTVMFKNAEPAVLSGALFTHTSRCFDFENSPGAEISPPLSWITMTCEFDPTFTPVRLVVMTEEDMILIGESAIDLNPTLRSLAIKATNHRRLHGQEFGDFNFDTNDEEHADNAGGILGNQTNAHSSQSSIARNLVLDEQSASPKLEGIRENLQSDNSGLPRSDDAYLGSRQTTNHKRASTPIASLDSVSAIKKHEYSPSRPPRTGTGGHSLS